MNLQVKNGLTHNIAIYGLVQKQDGNGYLPKEEWNGVLQLME